MNPPCPFPYIVPPLSCQLSSSMYFPLHRPPPPLFCQLSSSQSCPYIAPPLSCQLSSFLSVLLHRPSVVLPVFLFPVRSFASSFRCLVCFPLPCPSPYIVPPLYCFPLPCVFLYIVPLFSCTLPSSLSVPLHRPSVVLSAFLSPVRSLTSSLRYIASFPLPCPFPYIVPLLSCTLPSSLSVLTEWVSDWVSESVCPKTCRHINCSAHDEWLNMKLCMNRILHGPGRSSMIDPLFCGPGRVRAWNLQARAGK